MLIPIGFFGGGGTLNSYELISTTILGADTATVSFSSIPSTYKHLQLRIAARATRASNSQSLMKFAFNGDAGTKYAYHALDCSGGSVSSFGTINDTTFGWLPFPATTETAGIFGVVVFDLLDYASTSKNKTAKMLSGYSGTSNKDVALTSGLWRSTAAVSTITISCIGTLSASSRFSLYGIKG